MGWDRLVRLAAAVVAGVLLASGAARGDTESLLLGVGVAACVGVTYVAWRRSLATLAHIALGLLFANVLFWMATAAVANVSSGEELGDVAVPLALSVASLAGLFGVAGSAVDRRRPVRGAPIVAVGAVALFVVSLVASQVAGGDDVPLMASDLVVETGNVVFEPERLEVERGPLTVVTRNSDLFWHTFTIDALNVDVRVPVGARRRATFTVQPGSYDYYCAIPGHRALGMEGVLVVD